ncbi:class III signal peptide-containing protein [Methanocaldococcus sp. 10A]
MLINLITQSKRGQISLELGIIISSTVLVSIIVAYFYIVNFKKTQIDVTGKLANNTTSIITKKASNITQKLNNEL